jgi:hypothetical protein
MLGLVISLLVAAPVFPASASITCPQGPASCDAALEPAAAPVAPGGTASSVPLLDRGVGVEGYATPAVIDCRVPVVAPVLLTLVGECDGATQIASRPVPAVPLTDASYRASRYPESERPSGTLGPRRRDARDKTKVTTCTGVPSEGTVATASSPSQPLALFALPHLPRPVSTLLSAPAELLPVSGQLHPLDRPPRT